MLEKLRAKWREVKALPVGKRFATVHRRQRDAPAWVKPLVIAGIVLSLAIGVVLAIFPGPAFVFFGLAAALAATQSAWLARQLDRAEVRARELLARWRRRRQRYGAPRSR